MSVAGLMDTSKYSHNIIRTGDIMTNAPFTILNSEMTNTVIQLPLPVNLSSSMGSDWQQEQVSMVSSYLRHGKDKTSDLITSTSYKDVIKKLDAIAANVIYDGNKDVKEVFSRAMGAKSKLGGTRLAMNPRNEMLFKGMQFKSYSFTFNLVPLVKRDSDNIQNAIRQIQKASAPAMRFEKMFMEYPETWFVNFMSGGAGSGNKYLMKLNECCCTNVGVNYTPQGDSNNMHEENAPLAVELTLDFTEIFIPTKETIDEGFNG